MKERALLYLEQLMMRYPVLDKCRMPICEAYNIIENAYTENKKLLIAGNGGSAADAEHIVGELMKSFKLNRMLDSKMQECLTSVDPEWGAVLSNKLQGALPAIALDGHPALNTAYLNDCDPMLCFAQQVNGYGKEGDVLLAISTSGNSENIIYAVVTARAKGMKVIGLSGERNSKLSVLADVCIQVPQTETFMIQELHLPVYHCLCLMLEEHFFGEESFE